MSSPILAAQKSEFQNRLENAMKLQRFGGGQSARGVAHTRMLIQEATSSEIKTLSEDYSPLSPIIKYVYDRAAPPNDLISGVHNLIKLCSAKGIKANGGDYIDGRFERPLILAAGYGEYELVVELLQAGAEPWETDWRNRTAWSSLFDSRTPTAHSFHPKPTSRRLDIATVFLQRGSITPDLATSRIDKTKVYVNAKSQFGTPLLTAILTQKLKTVKFLVQKAGAVLTDRDYLIMKKIGVIHRLERAVFKLLPPNKDQQERNSKKRRTSNRRLRTPPPPHEIEEDMRVECWSRHNSWSFPPSYAVAIHLSRYCGLPEELFKQSVQPFLGREWFFTEEQLSYNLTPAQMRIIFGYHYLSDMIPLH